MNRAVILWGAMGMSLGLLGGYLLFAEHGEKMKAVGEVEAEPLFYRNPMNPEVTSPVPAQDSMGMDYIPVYAEKDRPANPGTVNIDPAIQANIGLRTAEAQRKTISRTIRAVGRVDYDEQKLVRLHPKVEGWIRDMRIDKTGQRVSDDDILLTIYSPKLVSAQHEYLLSRSNFEALKDSPFEDIRNGAQALMESSRDRLTLLDVPEHQIIELEQSQAVKEGLHIHAPAGGTVLKIGARPGQFVNPGTELYLIADISAVWVYADIYEYELPWVQEGDSVEMTLASVPGRTFLGEVSYIYPYAEEKTRTTKVRLLFDNPDGALRPKMLADVSIKAAEQPGRVVVPSEAVVRSGDYDQIFVVTSSGGFEPRRVVLGIESKGEVAVESGVSAGERVVVSAQFLIDSESKLREAAAKMLHPEKPSSHDAHEGMQHD